MHAGQACVVKEDNISERVYTIREGDTLMLQCLVTGHPRPQVSPCPGGAGGTRPPRGPSSPPARDQSLKAGEPGVRLGPGESWEIDSVGKLWWLWAYSS